MPEDFEPKQIFIAHEALWRAMERWARSRNLHLDRIPDGADAEGRPFFRQPGDGTECDKCGHTETYGFMPRNL